MKTNERNDRTNSLIKNEFNLTERTNKKKTHSLIEKRLCSESIFGLELERLFLLAVFAKLN